MSRQSPFFMRIPFSGSQDQRKYVKKCRRLGLEVVMNEGYEASAVDLEPVLLLKPRQKTRTSFI